jgi:hypothetical protein
MTADNAESLKTTTIVFIGDVMLGRLVGEQIPHRPPESFWDNPSGAELTKIAAASKGPASNPIRR